MTFFRKIFCGILLSTLAFSSVLLWSAHHVLVGRVQQSYVERYTVLTRTLGRAITEMEINVEAAMASAARVVLERELRTGRLSRPDLTRAARTLGVSEMRMVVDGSPRLAPAREFSTEDRDGVRRTSFLRPAPNSAPYKFLAVRAATGQVEVGVKITFLDEIMRRAIEDDHNVVAMNLFTADGQAIESFARADLPLAPVPADPGVGLANFDVSASVDSAHGPGDYRLEAVISNAEVKASLWRIQKTFIILQVGASLLALAVARVLAGRLSAKLSRVAKDVKRLTPTGERRRRLEVAGTDEVDRLADEFNKLLDRAESAQVDLLESQALRSFNELATQVAHDIRSPLAALVAFEKTQKELSEDRRLLLRAAVNRINDIANNLLLQVRAQADEEPSALTLELVPGTVSSLVSEKRMQYRARIGVELNYEVLPSAYGLFARLSSSELKRVLSNLIDNAFEAIADEGHVRVSVSGAGGRVRVQVQDTGAGIPAQVMRNLGARGNTAKETGCGLGLYHAFKTIRAWGGDVDVQTRPGLGTTVALTLVQVEAPAWFCPKVALNVANIVVVDDDISIHNIWRERFSGLDADAPATTHLATTEECDAWIEAHPGESALFLVDHEFIGAEENGIGFIARRGIADHSILVTSRFEDRAVQDECQKLGLQIIPKSMALYVPFERAEGAPESVDAILLDDDELVHSAWQLAAKSSGKRLWAFRDVRSFLSALAGVEPTTPIYIDHQLGDGLSGLDLVRGVLRRGFRRVHLATGDVGKFVGLSDVVVVGKSPAAEIS